MTPDKKTLKKIWAEVPVDYYFRLNPLQQLWHARKWAVMKQLITSKRVPKTILEVGCAAGHLTQEMSRVFPKAQIVGVDVYAPAITEAHKRFPHIAFKVADAHKLPFKNSAFDLVMTSETIEHVVDPKKMLSEIARVLKKDGTAVIEMDSGSWLFRVIWSVWTRIGNGKVWKHAHLHPFAAKELEELIQTSSFNIQRKVFSHLGMAVFFQVGKK